MIFRTNKNRSLIICCFLCLLFFANEVKNNCSTLPQKETGSLTATASGCDDVAENDTCRLSCPNFSHKSDGANGEGIIELTCEARDNFNPSTYNCVCDDTHKLNSAGDGCVLLETCAIAPSKHLSSPEISDTSDCNGKKEVDTCNLSCPSNSHKNGGSPSENNLTFTCQGTGFYDPPSYHCVCDDTHKLNSAGDGCVPLVTCDTAPLKHPSSPEISDTSDCNGKKEGVTCTLSCPSNSHKNEGSPSENNLTFTCQGTGVYDSPSYHCVCDDGYKLSTDGKKICEKEKKMTTSGAVAVKVSLMNTLIFLVFGYILLHE